MKSVRFCTAAVAIVLLAGASVRSADGSLAGKAQDVLKTHCSRCHGQDGVGKGGMNFILDRDKLLARQKIVPGSPADSPLWQRLASGEMPPAGAKTRPTPAEVALLKQWIEAGAPAAVTAAKRAFIADSDAVRTILDDLKSLPPRQRRFTRYFTFTNLHNGGAADTDLQLARHALAKLLNSLSWHPRVAAPWPVDPQRTVYRIDLRDYQWNANNWNRLVSGYPYPILRRSESKAFTAATGTELPYLRADWFVATASRAPLYYDLLQIPLTDRDLERLLRVDGPLDIQEERVVRAGFNGSGVSKNNRILERHDAGFGAYWRSYDFSDNTDRQNIFDHPLGPHPGQSNFEHAGGEIIFHLPNGLHGYMLVDANGRRLDRAPIEIVSDPKRPDKFVEAGVSCMSCHFQGLMHKADQVRAHAEKNAKTFAKDDLETIKALYVPESKFKALLDEDTKKFQKAVAKTGALAAEPEPVSTLTLRFEGEVDLASAAAEVGLQPADFSRFLAGSTAMTRLLGPLNVKGGTVQRQVFQIAFADLVREFRLGDETRPIDGISSAPIGTRPFQGHSGHVLALAFSTDGKRLLTGSEDNSARVWDVATGREIRPLEGHGDEVLAVVFSPDGRRLLTGAADRTVRLWDAASGRQLRLLEGHTERVAAVAFSPDGRLALSGSWDRSLSLWDLDTGRELRRFGGHASYVTSVAISPDGRHALSGSYDSTVRLWNLHSGKELRRYEGSGKEVYAVAFSPNGRRFVSAGNDNSIRLWDVDTGRELRRLDGHARAVIRLAFSPDGKRILSAASQYQGGEKAIRIWDTDSGKELAGFGGKGDTVWSVAFSADGRWAAAGNAEKLVRLWQLSR